MKKIFTFSRIRIKTDVRLFRRKTGRSAMLGDFQKTRRNIVVGTRRRRQYDRYSISSTGFAGSSSSLNYNNVATISGTRARVTRGLTQETGTVWSKNKVDIRKFKGPVHISNRSGKRI